MRAIGLTVLLVTISNVFMTFAWYAHLKELSAKPWMVAALGGIFHLQRKVVRCLA